MILTYDAHRAAPLPDLAYRALDATLPPGARLDLSAFGFTA